MDFVNSVELIFESTTISEEENFFSSAGIWENRDMSIESIREKAWQEKIK